MKRRYAVMLAFSCLFLSLFAACITRDASQRRGTNAETGAAGPFTVTYYQAGTVLGRETVQAGGNAANVPQGLSWRNEAGAAVDPSSVAVDRNMSFYVQGAAAVRSGHVRYMTYDNNLFRPDDHLSRGEMARVLCALVDTSAAPAGQGESFTDVSPDSEYYDNIETVSALGLMNGYGDGSFRPEADMTRGQLAAVLCRVMGVGETPALSFPDVAQDHWSMGAVASAVTKGWALGMGDGQFYPDLPVTRAAATVMINRAFGRTPDRDAIKIMCPKSPYEDVSKRHWAYYDIVEASYTSELMAYILGEVDGLRAGLILVDGQMCHVNAETLRLDNFQKGFHTISDGLSTDGLYYVPEDGYFIQRFQTGLQELDGSMFYVERDDGPFVTDYDLGYLHFGTNGRYTSGDDTVDAYVDAIVANILDGNSANLLNEDKLREGYNAILYGDYHYMPRPTGWVRGSTDWALGCAKVMFQTKRGACFYWAGAFLYIARRMGFQAYPICGGVNNNNALHAWVMIDDEIGNEYIYDVELDWGYSTGGDGRYRPRSVGSLFKQLRTNAKLIYIFPGETYIVPPSDDDDQHEDGVAIIWPTEYGTAAYVEIDGELIPLDTIWTDNVDENGNLIGYTVTVSYNGVVYTNVVLLQAPPTDPTPTPPVTVPPGPPTTEPPVNTDTPPVTEPPVNTDTPPVTDAPPVTDPPAPPVTDQPVVPDPPVDPNPVLPSL